MKNKYTVFLLYFCAVLIAAICTIQICNLSQLSVKISSDPQIDFLYRLRLSQTITLFLAIAAISILFAKEAINRELKRKAYTDVTGIKNKHACLEEMSMIDSNDNTFNIGFAMFDLNNLKKVNDFYGHEKGDELIHTFSSLLRMAADKKYFIGRFGGDEFILIIRNCTETQMNAFIGKLEQLVEKYNKGKSVTLSFASGYSISTKEHYYIMDDLLKKADKNMYINKKKMKSNRIETGQLSKILDSERIGLLGRDDLTGLLLNEAFFKVANDVMKVYSSTNKLAVVYADISNFRYFNDTYGYQQGNGILKYFAEELTSYPYCLCASRTFSSNFAFLADVSEFSKEEWLEEIERANDLFLNKIGNKYKSIRLNINCGVYFVSNNPEPINYMLDCAHIAHKHTKTSYQHIKVYEEELAEREKKKASIINSFQNALEQNEFKVYAQPKVFSSDKTICSAEVLVRWILPNGTIYQPDEFIPVLEQNGDIIDMDFYIYEKSFSYIYNRMLQNETMPLSLNVSRVHLLWREDFMKRIRDLLMKYPISPKHITFELTESTYIKDENLSVLFIEDLHKLGFKVSMDDFGSGYSSLKALKDMPFDEIKFDKEFLIDSNESGENLLLQMIHMVKGLNKIVVCEGVETKENVTLLEGSGCDVLQGFYYYKPAPLELLP